MPLLYIVATPKINPLGLLQMPDQSIRLNCKLDLPVAMAYFGITETEL